MFTWFQEFISSIDQKKKTNLLLVGFLIGALGLTVIITQQPTRSRQQAAETPGSVTLTLSPTSATVPVGQPLSVDLLLKAGSHNITGADITVTFNNAILSITQFTPSGQFNSEVAKTIDANAGTFHYVVTNTDPNTQITGDIKLGTLVLQPRVAGQADVNLLASQIVASDATESLSVSTENGSYTVEGQPSPSPTLPQPTTVPTNTPIPPTPTPTVPKITGIDPLQATPGTRVVIRGENFLLPEVPASSAKVLLVHSDNTITTLTSLLDAATNPNDPNPLWTQTSISFTLDNLPAQSGTIKVTIGNVFATWPETFTIVGTPTATPLPTNTPVPPTPTPTKVSVLGDANGDSIVDILDYNIWRDEFSGRLTTKTSDFNNDSKIDLLDFNIWRTAFGSSSPTSTPPSNPVSDLSITINPSTIPIKVTVATTEKTKLFDVTSTGAIQIQAGVTFNSGLFADPFQKTIMTKGQTVPVNIIGGNFTKAGVYKVNFSISTITNANSTVKTFSFPLEVTVIYANKISRVFVTSVDFKGDLYPYNGNGDNACTDRARIAGLGGVWRAWISSTNDTVGGPAQHFMKYSGPYKTINGTVNGGVIANNWDDLVDGGLQWRIDKDEFGRDRAGAGVWTGTDTNGTLLTAPYTGNCNDWSSSSTQALGWTGNSASGDRGWTKSGWISPTAGSASSCDTLNALYCFEQ